ncbi:MAG: hypothetical protein P4L51_18710 [Puia sp.]|nr:hypothetical protein [Puia sp.]
MSTSILQILGRKLKRVEVDPAGTEVLFTLADGAQYRMGHARNCCEKVWIADITGDLDDLENAWILMAEEISHGGDEKSYPYSDSWAFYKIASIRGYVTICWQGRSNGYYRTRVDFVEVDSDYDWKAWGVY